MMILFWEEVSHAQKLSIHVRNVPLEEVIETISKQTNIGFIYESDILKDTSKISVYAEDRSVIDLLNMLLGKRGLQCTLSNNVCYISRKVIQLEGKVIAETGEPIRDVSVMAGNRPSVSTDSVGRFAFNKILRGEILSFYHVTYRSRHIVYNGDPTILVKLISEIPVLDTVQVFYAGYVQRPKERAAGAYSAVSRTVLDRVMSNNLLSRLQAVTPGLLLIPRSVSGKIDQIQIRGKTSIGLVPGSLPYNDPLVIIDGMPFAENYY